MGLLSALFGISKRGDDEQDEDALEEMILMDEILEDAEEDK